MQKFKKLIFLINDNFLIQFFPLPYFKLFFKIYIAFLGLTVKELMRISIFIGHFIELFFFPPIVLVMLNIS